MTFDNSMMKHNKEENMRDAAADYQAYPYHKQSQSIYERMPTHGRKLSTAELLQAKALANSHSVKDIGTEYNTSKFQSQHQSPKKEVVRASGKHYGQARNEKRAGMSHSKSDHGLSLTSPTALQYD